MDACVAEIAQPALEKPPILTSRRLRHALLTVIAVGVLWRIVRYLEAFPIWGDEAMLLLNILERDYAGLTHHLRFAQVAPLFFLWLEKTALVVLGPSEWSVHFFPFVAGLLSLVIFWQLCRTSFSPLVAGLAVAILAVSYYPVRHGCEVKPYAFDLLFAATFAWLTLGHLRHPGTTRWLLALAVIAPVAVFSSYPSVFVGGAASLVLLPTMRAAIWTQRGMYALFNILLCGSFLAHLGLVGHGYVDPAEEARAREFLHDYWKDAFPPDAWYAWPLWLARVFTGNMLAYPIGANNGGSTVTFLLVMLGSIVLWRNHQRSPLALCWLPFALNLIAAIMHKYPFGDSARITLHLAPFICILMAHGVVQVLEWIRTPRWRARAELAAYVVLLICGAIGVARDVLKPFKTEHDRAVRQLVVDLKTESAGEPVYLCHQRDEELLAEFLWYMRTQSMHVDWLHAAAPSSPCWVAICSTQEPTIAQIEAQMPGRGWRIDVSDVRAVPPENARMAIVYCRKARCVRVAP